MSIFLMGGVVVMRNAIVLACDNSYMDKLETTIKSICAHNKNIKFGLTSNLVIFAIILRFITYANNHSFFKSFKRVIL